MDRAAEPEVVVNAIYSIAEHATFPNGQCIVVDGEKILY